MGVGGLMLVSGMPQWKQNSKIFSSILISQQDSWVLATKSFYLAKLYLVTKDYY